MGDLNGGVQFLSKYLSFTTTIAQSIYMKLLIYEPKWRTKSNASPAGGPQIKMIVTMQSIYLSVLM